MAFQPISSLINCKIDCIKRLLDLLVGTPVAIVATAALAWHGRNSCNPRMGCRLVFPSLWILIYLFCGFHSPHHNILFSKRTIREPYNVPVYHTPELDSSHWWHEIGRDPLNHWTNHLWQCCGLQQPWHKPFSGFLPVLNCQQSMSWGQKKVSRVRGKVEIFVFTRAQHNELAKPIFVCKHFNWG